MADQDAARGTGHAEDPALIAKLLEEADKQLKAKRNHDYVKTLVKLGEAYAEPDKKIASYTEAAEIYQKFSNASEAAKCFEHIRAVDASHAAAQLFLRDYYEKRRDWEKLIDLMRADADALEGDARAERYVEMAKLATDKIKKPQLCIDLWNEVRADDPGNRDALDALALFYERAREFGPLAEVLQQLVESATTSLEKLTQLQKLAQVQGERLNDDEGAAASWQQVLELAPDDRRAQENLKKRLVTLRRWDDLEALYADGGKWDELIRTLEAQEPKEREPEVRLGLLLKIADLWLHRKEKADRAAKAYEKVLLIDAANLAAAEALIPIHRDAQNFRGLAQVIEVKLQHVEHAGTREELLRELGQVQELKLKNPQAALEAYLGAFALESNLETIDSAQRAAGASGGWNGVIAALRGALESQYEPEHEVALRLRLGRVLLEETGAVDGALEQYRAVYELQPDSTDALEALERLYRETKRHAELLEVYERQRELATDTETQTRVLLGIASMQENELGAPERAIETYLQILEAVPGDETALEALDRLYQAQEDWTAYADVLARRLEGATDEAQIVDLKCRLGETLERHVGDSVAALDCYREVVSIDPDEPRSRAALEAMLGRDELRVDAARTLADVYQGRQDWRALVGVLEVLVEAEVAPGDRSTLLRRIARLASEQLDDTALAFDASARALAQAPESDAIHGELRAAAEAGESWDRLADVYARLAADSSDPVTARLYGMRLAAVQEQLGRIDDAARSYAAILERDPADVDALDFLEQMFARHERFDDVIGVIRRRLEVADDDAAREALLAQIAAIHDEQLGQTDLAIAAYVEILAFDERSAVALKALEGLYERQQAFESLAGNLEQQMRAAESEDLEVDLMMRLGKLQESQLGLVSAAIETYRQVIERRPRHAAAMAALEALGTRPEYEVEIAEVLGPIHRAANDHAKLLAVYEVQIRRAEDPARAVDLLHEVAELQEVTVGDPGAAFDALVRALALDPSSGLTQESLERLAETTDRYADLARAYEEQAATHEESDLAVQLFAIAASIQQLQLGDVDAAVALHRRILELDPGRLASVEALEVLFQQGDRHRELSAALQQRAALLVDIDQQKAALMEAAALEEDVLANVEAAVSVYRRILEIDSEDMAATDALIRLYLGLERWDELLAAYARKVDALVDGEERKRVLYQVAAVHERELNDVASGIATYQRILEIDPDDLEALGRLDALHQEAEQWEELLGVLQREAELAADPDEALSYRFRIAELYEVRLDDSARAVDLYREILEQQADHEPTIAALANLVASGREALAAAKALEPIHEANEDWRKLVAVLEVQAAKTDDAFAQVEILGRMARVLEEQLDEASAAFDAVARAIGIDSTREDLLSECERLAASVGRWSQLAALYDRQLESLEAEDAERFVELAARLAGIQEEQLENWDAAIRRYEQVLERVPDHAVAMAALDRLYEHTEKWDRLASVLAREADAGTSESVTFRYRLAQVQQLYLSDVRAAISSYGDVLTTESAHEGALRALEALFDEQQEVLLVAGVLAPHYESTLRFDALAGVYEAVLDRTTDAAERVEQFHRLAELQEQQLESPAIALSVYVRALGEAPTDERVLSEVERLAAFVDDGWERLATAYADVLERATAPAVQGSLGKRLARVFEEQLDDLDKAVETYEYVLSIDGADEESLENLDRLHSASGDSAKLAAILEKRVATTDDALEKTERLLRLGELYSETLCVDDLKYIDDAIRVHRQIAALDPGNEVALGVLERLYREQERWKDLLSIHELQLACASGEHEEGDILARMGRLLSGVLEDSKRAVETWKRVLELRGDDGEALDALGALYEKTQQWAELTEILERQLTTVTDDGELVSGLLRRARLCSQQLKRDDMALEDYARVLDIDVANLDALRAMADIHRARLKGKSAATSGSTPADLIDALHQMADRAGEQLAPEALAAVYRELAMLQQSDDERRADAIDAWRKLLEVEPKDLDAIGKLEALYRADEAWRDVADVKMLRGAALEKPDARVKEYLDTARLWSETLEDPDGGVPAFEAVLQVDPAHDEAFRQLERLHREAERWEPLIELYLARLETRDEVEERTSLLRKVARVFEEHVGDAGQAFDSLETAFTLDFADEETIEYLERMASKAKRWPQLIQTANALLDAETVPRRQVALCLRLAKWYGENLDRQDYAQPFYARIQELEPNNIQVRRQAASFQKKQGDWRGAGQRLEEALPFAARDVERAAILTDIGDLLEKYAGQPDQAVGRYQRAVDADATYLPALDALERLYDSKNLHAELAGILEKKLVALKDPERVAEAALRVAGLYEVNLRNVEKAVPCYRRVLDHEPESLAAIRGLERSYGELKEWPELLEMLERHLDVAPTERERAEVLGRIAALQEEEFRKPELAAERLEQVVDIDPTNTVAFEGLARCYQKVQAWSELVGTLDRHVQMVDDRARKIELLLWQGEVIADSLEDPARAIDSYLAIVDLDASHIGALEALAKLYDRIDEHASSLEYMSRIAELTSDGRQRVEAFYRAGKQYEEKLGDRGQAKGSFEQALDLNPYHLPTLAAMRAIALDEGDFYSAARYLETEQEYTESGRVRAKLLVELGRIRTELMELPEEGLEAYRMAHGADPENEDAALPLVRIYVEREQFSEAEPLTELLENKASGKERDVQLEYLVLRGRVAMALGKGRDALQAYAAAHKVAPADPQALRGLADANFQVEDWAGALTHYQKILTAIGDDDPMVRAEILHRLGCVKREQGQAKQAIHHFEKALELEPSHRPTLDALAAVHGAAGDWEESCRYRQMTIDSVLDGDERFALLLELSETWETKVGDPERALAAVEQAVDLKPEDHQIQHRLLALYQKTSRWEDVVNTLRRIADGDSNAQRRARYLFAMGQVLRDKLEDPYQAVDQFEEALDVQPEFFDAFTRIEKILTGLEDWSKLERAYRKMIHRISGKGHSEFEFNLWHSLGLVFRDHLQDYEKAANALRAAVALKPEAVELHVVLAELSVHTGNADNALDQYRALLEADIDNIDAYRSIYTLHLQHESYDAAWAVASVLNFLGRANEEEQRFFEDWRTDDVGELAGSLDAALWTERLFHKDEDVHIGRIYEAILPAALRAKVADLTAKKLMPALPESARQEPGRAAAGTLPATFGWAARALEVDAPPLFLQPDQPGYLMAVPGIPVASVAGKLALQGLSSAERAFVCGRHLAMVRGEHRVKAMFPTVTELTVLLFGAIGLVAQVPAPPELAAQVQATTRALGQFVEPLHLEHLKVAVADFLKSGSKANVKKWAQAVETTAARAGLLLCGDLVAAKKMLSAEAQIPGDLTPQERMRELVLFCISEDYGLLREALGMNIRGE